MKTINLEEIFRSHNKIGFWQKETVDNVLAAMREACNQAIELSAENAQIVTKMREDVDELSMPDEWTISTIDIESILNTKSQII